MNRPATVGLRSLATSGLFAVSLVAFLLATVLAMVATGFSDSVSVFFFDLLGHTFPIACPNTVGDCLAVAHGWNENWSFVVWGAVAIGHGILVRNRPMRQKLLVAALIIPVVILLMQVGMNLAGFKEFVDSM